MSQASEIGGSVTGLWTRRQLPEVLSLLHRECEDAVRKVIPLIAIATAASLGPALAQESIPLANIEIRMVKTSTKPPVRVTSESRNPNDFAVRDVDVTCTIKDKNGNQLVAYSSTIFETFEPHQRKITKNLSIGAWPEQGLAALCISKSAKLLTATAPAAAATTAPAAAPAPATSPAPPEQSGNK